MNRNEIINLLHDKFYIRKGDLTSVKKIIEAAKEKGFIVEKQGVDNFSIYEEVAIRDFTKPLRIVRGIPNLQCFECYNGVPIHQLVDQRLNGGWFNYSAWCYLANKQDGEYINFADFSDETPVETAKRFDSLKHAGYIEETDKEIIFYIYAQSSLRARCTWDYACNLERFTPVIYK